MRTRVVLIKVVGVTFEGRQALIAQLNIGDPARIVPEPDNPHDPNALAVHVAHGGAVHHVGYVKREVAAEIAPHFDGESMDGKVYDVTGGGSYNYGLIVRVEIPDEA